MAPGHSWTQADSQAFLEALAKYGVVSFACQAAGVARSSAYELRKVDLAFASAWDEAVADSTERMEVEAIKRATEGTTRPVFHKGEVVGGIQEYSDTLLMFMLKGRKPGMYREKLATDDLDRGDTVNEEFELKADGYAAGVVDTQADPEQQH